MDKQQNDEIDLQQLAVRLLQYFQRNFRFIAISSAVGIGTGIIGWLALPKVYESKMILMSDILTESYSDRITESLDNLIKEKNLAELALRLKLTEPEAMTIKEINIESVKQSKDPNSPEETIFIITASIGDRTILPKLQDGMINFLRNNEFVKVRVRQRENLYQAMIDKLDQEIRSLDSLKQRLFEGKPLYNKSAEMLLIDPTSIYTKIVELHKQRLDYKNMLELSNSIQLVEGFTVFEKPAEPKISVLLIGGFLLGFLVSVGMLAFEEVRKLAKTPL